MKSSDPMNNAPSSSQTVPSNIPQELLPLTREEQDLLQMYETVKSYERIAMLAQSAAAQKKLAEADEKYQRDMEKAQGRSSPSSSTNDGEEEIEDTAQDSDDDVSNTNRKRATSSAEDYEEDILENEGSSPKEKAKKKAKSEHKSALQRGKEKAEASARKQEEYRQKLLVDEGTEALDMGPSIVKKAKIDSDVKESYLHKMEGWETPPHDFSKKLNFSKVSGHQLFPDSSQAKPTELIWTPPDTPDGPEDRCLEVKLNDFDLNKVAVGNGNNTVAVKFIAPSDSKRFSINITSENHANYDNVLFHFNPRQHEKGGQLVINDKQDGQWGQGLNIPLATLPLIFGQKSSTLIVQITGDGFDVFLEGKHCARLEHRTPLPSEVSSLVIQMPSTDDYGKPESWKVAKVWWGHKPPMAKGDLSNIAGYNTNYVPHPKKLFISGLSKIHTEPEVDLRRAELERAFKRYAGTHGVTVIVPTNSTYAFVEVDTERKADLALKEMAGRYRLNRARRSRHELLMEKRALSEIAGPRMEEKSSGWG